MQATDPREGMNLRPFLNARLLLSPLIQQCVSAVSPMTDSQCETLLAGSMAKAML